MSALKISVALVTFNGEKYLKEQLNSISNQTLLPDELIVFDDCSSDNSISIINKFIESAPFEVKLFQNTTNLGVSKNFGIALSQCNGDLIFLCDQDDYWFNNKIEVVSNYFYTNQDVLLFINDGILTDSNLVPSKFTQGQQLVNSGLNINQLINGCFSAISKDILPFILPIDFEYPFYDTFIHRVGNLLESKLFINKPLQFYRRHSSNTSSNSVSSLTKISKFKAKSIYYGENTKNYLLKELEMLEIINLRILNLVGNNNKIDLLHTISKIENEKDLIRRRLEVLQCNNFFLKLYLASNFLIVGGYNNFAGINSYFKDIIKKY